MHATITIKRVYEAPAENDGFRVLVDRLWPRGIRKADVAIDEWQKELAPSTELRKWFNHDPEKWTGFQKKYEAELRDNPALDSFLKSLGKHKKITLLYAAKDEQHNQAVVLQEVLRKHL
ncbi:DUF488 domain-containing protein [Niabella drilacis]|uniref:Uncharacterized conserved protein YeaO, DUF488 family n=1 Tax=Niabella drilacis (strain DSM 25811 / CCM 8410 / CCUG 62505 / LMG 26954 / E90) TaxID=1285928 RepID=A0A1G6T373_NIADE|nr:DUF488 domain-containing protein [Niabella drilacis]SDD23630.1 Uncharacterized conserved protein YeaO, DUF488 family [Niabella drilacis]